MLSDVQHLSHSLFFSNILFSHRCVCPHARVLNMVVGMVRHLSKALIKHVPFFRWWYRRKTTKMCTSAITRPQSTLKKQHYARCLDFCEHICSVE